MICKFFCLMKQNAFNLKFFPLFWDYIFPLIFGTNCNCINEVMVRRDGSLLRSSNVLTWQDKS